MENLNIGLELMVVGMCTVFLILLIVIWGGDLLINLVNKIAPEEAETPAKAAKTSTTTAAVDGTAMSVLQAVVDKLTGGKGHIASVKKV